MVSFNLKSELPKMHQAIGKAKEKVREYTQLDQQSLTYMMEEYGQNWVTSLKEKLIDFYFEKPGAMIAPEYNLSLAQSLLKPAPK